MKKYAISNYDDILMLPCPICDAYGDNVVPLLQLSTKTSNIHILYCKLCHFGFRSPMPTLEEKKANLFPINPYIAPTLANPDLDRPVFRWTAKKLRGILGKNGHILDIGCGEGHFLKEMKSMGWEVTGLEIDPRFIEAINNNGIRCFCGDVSEVTFDRLFDVISFRQVMEYVPYPPQKVLDTVKEWLKPKGLVYINIANSLDWKLGLMQKYRKVNINTNHCYHFSRKALNKILLESKFIPLKWYIQPPSKGSVKFLIGYWILLLINKITLSKWDGVYYNIGVIAQKKE